MTCPTAQAIGTLHTFANADWHGFSAYIAEHGPIDWATQNSAKGRDAYGAASGAGGFSLLPSLTDSPGASASGAFSGGAKISTAAGSQQKNRGGTAAPPL